MDTTYTKVKNYIEKHHMIEDGDLIAVGVSGGADSVCLLDMMHRLSGERCFSLLAVHVDHGVRAESAQDAAYVEKLCRNLGIPFVLRKVDMEGYAAANGMSLEEAGRMLRYGAFEEALREQRPDLAQCRIAVAHNADDRAETMLFHLFRGSGIKGMGSIRPVRESVIRPLLCLERNEIESYLACRKLHYCHDCTNDSDAYARNRIRHHILPYAKEEICAGAVGHMNGLADLLEETERYLTVQTEKLWEKYVEELQPDAASVSLCVCAGELLREDPVMYRRVLLACLEGIAPYRKDITRRHVESLEKLIRGNGSKELFLPCGIRAYKEYDRLFLYRKRITDEKTMTVAGKGLKENAEADSETEKAAYTIVPPVELCLPDGSIYSFTLFECDALYNENQQNIPRNRYTKWFDYDKITTTVLLRTKRPGDFLSIDAALHKKSVKQYMINEKIPKIQRDSMYLLADGSHIMWIPGYRISQQYKVDESTRRILQVQLRGGHHGGTNRSIID
ncbi:MAG: tRNA lysidine(34) synthetase TilS [Lachnospiraceae bacterium]|nr:tRNA lysidine(34) synthetase TilS [Lachnospiraceae bacterium]